MIIKNRQLIAIWCYLEILPFYYDSTSLWHQVWSVLYIINNFKYSQAVLFLKKYGGLVMGTSSLKIWAYFFKNKMDFVDKIVPGLELAEFIVTIWGSIVVFSKL